MWPNRFVAGLYLALSFSCLATPLAAAPPALAAGPAVRVGAGANPQVAVFSDGAFVVVWNGVDASGAGSLHARLFDRTGAPRTGEIELLQPAGQVLDGVAALPAGFVVVWEQVNAHGLESVLARLFSRRGAPLGAPFKVHADSSYDRCCALVAPGPGAGFTVAWTSYVGGNRDPGNTSVVDSRSFDSSGRPLGAAPVDPPLDNATPYPFELDQSFAIALTVDPSGEPATVVVDQGDEWTLDLSRGGGETGLEPDAGFVAQFEVNASMLPGGAFAVAWATGDPCCSLPASLGSSILVRRLSADGTPLGGGPVQANRRSGWEESPHLATLPDGSYFVLWAEISDQAAATSVLFARSFDGLGAPTSRERPIGANPASRQVQPALVARPDGDAVAVWVEEGPGPLSVFARVLAVPAR